MAVPFATANSPFSRQGGAATPKGLLLGLNFSHLTVDPTLGPGDSGRIWWREDLGKHYVWDGTTASILGGSLQDAYNGGSDILVAPNQPLQLRNNGIKADASTIFTGLVNDINGQGLAFTMIGDGTGGIPTTAGGQQVLLDTAVTFPAADQIEFGVDLRTVGGGVISPAAAVGAGTTAINGSIVSLKTTDVSPTDVGQYTIVGFANGITTNSIAIVVDALTDLPPTFTATSGIAKIFKQGFGFGSDGIGGAPQHGFLGLAQGDGTSSLFGVFSDGGNYNSVQSLFNIGDLTQGLLVLGNLGTVVGKRADVPFLFLDGFGIDTVDNADIAPSLRTVDPAVTATFGPSTVVSFTDNGANPDTITVSGGGLFAANFLVNSDLVVSGSTSNDGQYRITGLTDDTITLSPSDALTTEAAGASVTLTDRRLPPGGMWYDAANGIWKYYNNVTFAAESLGASTLQKSYDSGNNILTSTTSGPVAIRAAGAEYGKLNVSPFIFDTTAGVLASTPGRIISGGQGAPHWTEQNKVVDDTATTVRNDTAVGTDISFAAPNQINSVTTDFVASGFQAGDTFTVSGTASNDGDYEISVVAVNQITVTGAVVNEAAGASVTLTGWTKIDFGASNNLNTAGVAVTRGAYANSLTIDFSVLTVKSTDISPTDEGDWYKVVNVSDGVGTASVAQIATLITTNPAFTSTTTTSFIANTHINFGPKGINIFGSPDLDWGGTSAGLMNVLNDGGVGYDLSRLINLSNGQLINAGLEIVNLNNTGSANVPLIKFGQSGDAGDFRFTSRIADPTTVSDGEVWYDASITRTKIDAGGTTEQFAYVSDTLSADKGVATRSLTGGNQVIAHSLGKVPSLIRIKSYDNANATVTSDGSWDGNNNSVAVDGTGAIVTSSNIVYLVNGANSMLGSITAATTTNFTINWSPSGAGLIVPFLWEAIA